MSTERVDMVHPKLPGRTIKVRPAGVKARQRAGWQLATAPKNKKEA